MIGGNTAANLQLKTTTKNAIGESIATWETVNTLTGFLDLSNGESKYTPYSAKIEDSTHFFFCDYTALDSRITSENSRLLINGKIYQITLIDDPMGLHQHYEFYLKFTGGQ